MEKVLAEQEDNLFNLEIIIIHKKESLAVVEKITECITAVIMEELVLVDLKPNPIGTVVVNQVKGH